MTTNTYWTISGLSTGLTYYWRVAAINSGLQTSSVVKRFIRTDVISLVAYFEVCTPAAPGTVSLATPTVAKQLVDVTNITLTWVCTFKE